RLAVSPKLTEHVSTRYMQLGPAVKLWMSRGERVENGQPGRSAIDNGDGHRAVRLDYRAGLVARQLLIQAGDLAPVGVSCAHGCGVAGGDRGLDLVGPRLPGAKRPLKLSHPLGDLRVVPSTAVLVGEEHEVIAEVKPS